MTDTLPSWALEKAREVALRWFHPSMVGHVRLRDAIATALSHAYQQGKQDGQREMKERAAETAESLSNAAHIAFDIREEIFPNQSNVRAAIADAIRRLDEVQDDA